MTTVLVAALAAYLIGGVPFSYVAGKLAKGIDLRRHGSGNLGASNTYRILGGRIALAVLMLDIAKGLVPVLVAQRFDAAGAAPLHALAAGAGAVVGHLFSPYLRLAGGKGIATSAGVFAGLSPLAFACALVVFAAVFAARRIVSLASLSAATALPLAVYLLDRSGVAREHASVLWVTVLVMVAVVIKHRSNIRRLAAGTEPALQRSREGHP